MEGENSSCQTFHMVRRERKYFNHRQPEEKGFYHSWCIMCKAAGEDIIDHFFFFFLHCTVASELWAFMLTLMGLHWMMLRRLINLIIIWLGQCGERVISSSWGAIPTCLLWTIWQERNLRQFEGKVHSII